MSECHFQYFSSLTLSFLTNFLTYTSIKWSFEVMLYKNNLSRNKKGVANIMLVNAKGNYLGLLVNSRQFACDSILLS